MKELEKAKENRKKWEPKISNMFDSIAVEYEKINTFMSMGMDSRWRGLLIKRLRQYWQNGAILDVGCGPGSLAKLARKKFFEADIISMDISPKMLEIAVKSGNATQVVCASASSLPCPDGSYGAIISAFVLRNLPDLNLFYQEAHRILHKDGVMVLLDLTRPTLPFVGFFHSLYMRVALPFGAKLFRSNLAAYQYLNQSILQCYQPDEMVAILQNNGFKAMRVEKLCLGTVTLYTFAKK